MKILFKLNTKKMYLSLIILVIIFAFCYPYIMKEDTKHIENKTLLVMGIYKINISLEEISNISLHEDLPVLNRRENGLSAFNIRKGYFVGDKKYYLNINKSNPQFIYIIRNEEMPVIINFKDSNETVLLYEKLKEELNIGAE